MNQYKEQFLIWWNELTAREQIIVLGGGIAFVLAVFFGGMVYPLVSAHDKADRALERRAGRLFEIQQIEAQQASQPKQLSSQGRRLQNRSAISLIESIARKAEVSEQLSNIRPGGTESEFNREYIKANVELKGLTMKNTTDLLYELEIGSGYDVEVVQLQATRKDRNEKRLDLSMELRLLK